jgi:hypothetical protein
MLILSQLNDQEANYVTPPYTLPVPMRAALSVIIQQFQKGDTDEIKIAALLGLARHLEWDNYKQLPSTTMPAIRVRMRIGCCMTRLPSLVRCRTPKLK